jgi:TonB family protein
MRKSYIYSGIIHLVIIVAIFLFSPSSSRLEGYPTTIYRVGLVSLPGGRQGGAKVVEGTAALTVSKKESKGISAKEFNPTPPKKKSKKTADKTKGTASSSKKEGKITQKDEKASEYGLGNGISAATLDGSGLGSPYYLTLVFGKIRDGWDNPVETSATLTVTVYFKILKDGQVLDAQVEKSSGIDLFDQSALRSILSSVPFPPLPVEYTGDYLGIHLEFEYVQ